MKGNKCESLECVCVMERTILQINREIRRIMKFTDEEEAALSGCLEF